MARRVKMSKRHSKRVFSKHAMHVAKKNNVTPMRGGWRL